MIARMLREEVRQLLQRHPGANVVVMPESSVYSPYVFSTPAIAAMFSAEHIGRPIDLIAGSFYRDGGKYRNACYWLRDGVLRERFDKRHAMPLTERVPSCFNFGFVRDMYFSSMPQIDISDNKRPCMRLPGELKLVPYICSELFFNEWPDSDNSNDPIVFISNDSWCPARYIRHLMYLMARFRAIQWQRDVLFVSFNYAAWLGRWGGEQNLQSYSNSIRG